MLRAAGALLGDMQDLRLGLVEDLLRAASERVVGRVRNVAGGCGKLAQDRAIADDLRVVPDIRRRRHIADQRTKVGKPADIVEFL